MLPSQFAIEKTVISWMLVLVLGIGGMVAFFSLGQLEDPPFTIKDAKIIVAYPGASAEQVEEEVTYPVEQALQQLSSLDEVLSTSSAGLSQITAKWRRPMAVQHLSRSGIASGEVSAIWSYVVSCRQVPVTHSFWMTLVMFLA